MDKILWFIYGFLTACAVAILGIVGWGISIFMRILSYFPIGLMVGVALSVIIIVVLEAIRYKKKQINP